MTLTKPLTLDLALTPNSGPKLWPGYLVLSRPDGLCLLLTDNGLELLVPGVTHAAQGDAGCGEWVSAQLRIAACPGPPSCPTCEEVVAVLLQLLGLGVEAASATAGGWCQPLAQCLEGCPAFGGKEDHDGVVLHVVEALNCRGCHVQECMLVLGQARSGHSGQGEKERGTDSRETPGARVSETGQKNPREMEMKSVVRVDSSLSQCLGNQSPSVNLSACPQGLLLGPWAGSSLPTPRVTKPPSGALWETTFELWPLLC